MKVVKQVVNNVKPFLEEKGIQFSDARSKKAEKQTNNKMKVEALKADLFRDARHFFAYLRPLIK